ncbi:MAG: hypothetical protein ACOCW2_03615 [Chitinivibrionales bacterium]
MLSFQIGAILPSRLKRQDIRISNLIKIENAHERNRLPGSTVTVVGPNKQIWVRCAHI